MRFSLESVDDAEEWLCSILCAMKAKPLLDSPISESLSDDSIAALLSEWDEFGLSHPPSLVKVSSLVFLCLRCYSDERLSPDAAGELPNSSGPVSRPLLFVCDTRCFDTLLLSSLISQRLESAALCGSFCWAA